MHRLRLALLVALGTTPVAAAPGGGDARHAAMPGVENPARARIDYMLKCQGCHQPDGAGNSVNTPPLKGEVARFLSVPGGRAFIGRVPGVASVDLDDARLADVVNYSLYSFDRANLPRNFRPYTARELGELRRHPLRLDRAEERARLIAAMTPAAGR